MFAIAASPMDHWKPVECNHKSSGRMPVGSPRTLDKVYHAPTEVAFNLPAWQPRRLLDKPAASHWLWMLGVESFSDAAQSLTDGRAVDA